MVKHNKTICQQIADEFSVLNHFVGLELKGLTYVFPVSVVVKALGCPVQES